MVFCENRNLDIMKSALVEDLGYGKKTKYKNYAKSLIDLYSAGKNIEEILSVEIDGNENSATEIIFKNVDGIKFLTHDMGCGGTRQDAQALCSSPGAGFSAPGSCASVLRFAFLRPSAR